MFDAMELVEAITKGESIVLAGHVNPDGDAVGSCFSTALSLALTGKKPVVLLEGYTKKLDFLAGKEYIFTGDINHLAPDVFVSLDCSSKDRLGRFQEVFDRAKLTINIDHHMSNTYFAKLNFVDEKASSTCEALFGLLSTQFPVTKDIASALYTGIVFDTGGFLHDSATPETLEIASRLMRMGIESSQIQRRVLYIRSLPEIKAMGTAIGNLVIKGETAYACLTKDEMEKAGADFSDLDGIVECILNIEGVEASVFFTERPGNQVKASFRSKNINVNKIAVQLGGGGHYKAAGAALDGDLKSAVERVIPLVEAEIGASRDGITG